MANKKQTSVNISTAEYKRLKRLDDRQMKMRPLILTLANYVRQKKEIKKAVISLK